MRLHGQLEVLTPSSMYHAFFGYPSIQSRATSQTVMSPTIHPDAFFIRPGPASSPAPLPIVPVTNTVALPCCCSSQTRQTVQEALQSIGKRMLLLERVEGVDTRIMLGGQLLACAQAGGAHDLARPRADGAGGPTGNLGVAADPLTRAAGQVPCPLHRSEEGKADQITAVTVWSYHQAVVEGRANAKGTRGKVRAPVQSRPPIQAGPPSQSIPSPTPTHLAVQAALLVVHFSVVDLHQQQGGENADRAPTEGGHNGVHVRQLIWQVQAGDEVAVGGACRDVFGRQVEGGRTGCSRRDGPGDANG